jgi:Fe(3+) dicitrate transport protein
MQTGSTKTFERIALAIALAYSTSASAQQQAAPDGKGAADGKAEAVELETVRVVGEWLGTATEQDVRRYPGARTLLGERELRRSGARNLEEALRQAPGVQIRDETGLGILPNIGVRGLNPLRSERVMVLVDGIPLALAPYTGTGLSLFPVTAEMVERIDVVRGGVAVRYGPNNVGGVINIITRPIPRKTQATLKQQLTIAESSGRVFSDSYARVGGFVTPDLGLQLQANFQTGEGERDHSNTDVRNLQLDGIWLPGNDSELKAQLQYYKADAELPGALTPAAYNADRTQSQRPFDAFEGETWRGALTYTQFFGDNAEFTWMNFAHTSSREFAFGQPFDPRATTTSVSSSPRDFLVAGTEPRQTWRFQTAGVTHTLTLGGRFVREEVDFVVDNRSLTTGTVTRQRDWRFDTNAFAGYVSDTLAFHDGRVEVTPGVRFERVDTGFRNNQSGATNSNLSKEWLPGLTLGYHATESALLFANANRSLRPPQVAQVTLFGGEVASELAWNYEAGARFKPLPSFDVAATAFRIDFEDQIEFDRSTLRFRNLGETQHQGVELEASWKPRVIRGTTLKANYTFVDAEQRAGANTGKDVPFASKHSLNLSADYMSGPYRFNVNGFYQSSAFSDAANTSLESADGRVGEIPSYWVWNVALTYATKINNRPVTLSAAANNIFDRDYFFRGVDVSPIGRVPAPGRSFLVSAKIDL